MPRTLFLPAALMLIVVASELFAGPGNPAVASIDDDVYQSVRRLALAAGQSPPPAVTPISYAELEAVLRRVDIDRLSPELQNEFLETLELVSPVPEFSPAGSIGLCSTVEGYFHTSDEYDEWLYWYPDRRSLLSIPIRVSPLAPLSLVVDLDWRKNYPYYVGYEDNVVDPDPISNIFTDLRETDVQFPFTAYLSAAGTGWSVQFGRSRVGWGLGHTGSLLLSDHVDYQDFLLATLTGGMFGYRALYLDLEPWLNGGGTDPERIYMGHRIEFRPTSWLSLTANEAMVFYGKEMELRYLNPLMILHSWFMPDYANSMINIEAAVRPFGGLEFYAHLAIDQLQSAIEEERGYTDSEPEAMGYLAGAEYVMPLAGLRSSGLFPSGTWLSVGTEWVYLDPWMYIGRELMGSFTYRRRVQAENVLPAGAKVIVEKCLGYPAGPDYYGITGFATLDLGPDYHLALDLTFYAKGENDVGRSLPPDDEEDATRTTPSGDAPEFVTAGRLSGDGVILRTELFGIPIALSGGAVLDVVRILNNDHESGALLWDVQFSPYLSVETSFGN